MIQNLEFLFNECFLKLFISFLLIHMYVVETKCLKAIDLKESQQTALKERNICIHNILMHNNTLLTWNESEILKIHLPSD